MKSKAFQRELALGAVFVAVVSVAIIAVAVVLSGDAADGAARRASFGPSPTAQRVPTVELTPFAFRTVAVLAPFSDPVTFDGSGNPVTSRVQLLEGQVVLKMRHRGTSMFVVRLLPESGAATVSISTIGSYTGARLHRVRKDGGPGLAPGLHRLEITADGPWRIELRPTEWDASEPAPYNRYEGADDLLDLVTEPAETQTPESSEECSPQLHC